MQRLVAVVACLGGACLAGASSAEAARLRGSTTLAGNDITIADIWDDVGPDAARVLGPAPVPGARITVEAPQLAAIARQFGVAWHPASPTDRAMLDRPGRPLARETVIMAVRAALVSLGAPEDADIELAAYLPPMLPLDDATRPTVEQCEYDAATGRFTATLVVATGDAPAARQRLVGRLQEMVELPTPTHRLVPGSAIAAQDLRMTRVAASGLHTEPVRSMAEAIGMASRHSALAGQPIARAELIRPMVVEKGSRVTMELQAPGLAVLTTGQAAESGGIGDRVTIINLASRAMVQGEIVAAGRVRVLPDTLPNLAPSALDTQFAGVPPSTRLR